MLAQVSVVLQQREEEAQKAAEEAEAFLKSEQEVQGAQNSTSDAGASEPLEVLLSN